MNIKGKNILLTGASRGIGVMMAHELAGSGADLMISSRSSSKERLEQVANALESHGTRIRFVLGDIRDQEDRMKIVDSTIDKLGSLDVLINNAGLEHTASFEDTSPDMVKQIVDTNLVAPIETARLALSHMKENGSGHIVNVASLAGRVPLVYNSIYSATKSGLITWTKTVSDEYRETNIGFSAVCPGFVSVTGMHARHRTKAPFIAAEITPQRVARSVIRAIEQNRLEVLINSRPVRPLLGLWEWFPGVKNIVYRHFGLLDFMKEVKEKADMSRAAY